MPDVGASYLLLMSDGYIHSQDALSKRISAIAQGQGLSFAQPGEVKHCHSQFNESLRDMSRPGFSRDTRVSCLPFRAPSSSAGNREQEVDADENSYVLAVTNPSVHNRQGFSFRSSLTHLDIHWWCPALRKWISIAPRRVNAICDGQVLTLRAEKKCDIYVDFPVEALATAFFKVTVGEDAHETRINGNELAPGTSRGRISNALTELEVSRVDWERGALAFRKTDIAGRARGEPNASQYFKFSLGLYKTLQPRDDPTMHRNGHYAFSTKATDTEPFAWIKSVRTYRNEEAEFEQIIVEFVDYSRFKYNDETPLHPGDATAFVKISLADHWDPDGFVKFEVNLPDVGFLFEGGEKKGFEIVAVWESLIASGDVFYTDANGVELMKREWRPGRDDQHIPANYYPVTSMIGIRDDDAAMTVLNDRAQGGSSI